MFYWCGGNQSSCVCAHVVMCVLIGGCVGVYECVSEWVRTLGLCVCISGDVQSWLWGFVCISWCLCVPGSWMRPPWRTWSETPLPSSSPSGSPRRWTCWCPGQSHRPPAVPGLLPVGTAWTESRENTGFTTQPEVTPDQSSKQERTIEKRERDIDRERKAVFVTTVKITYHN